MHSTPHRLESNSTIHWTTYALFGVILFLLLVLVAVGFVGCAGWDAPNPAATKPSADYPCGVIRTVCSTNKNPALDTCCGQNEACPGDPGCKEPGYCCNAADFDPSPQYGASRGDGGAPALRPTHPVWLAQ
jgi:hypothetical protein